MLWFVFGPGSQAEVAQRAARVLGCSQRQVINWLQCEHDPGLRYVARLWVLAVAERRLRRMEGRR
jgi:hypothetical protein